MQKPGDCNYLSPIEILTKATAIGYSSGSFSGSNSREPFMYYAFISLQVFPPMRVVSESFCDYAII